MEEKKEYWKSELGLILAGLGMAVGCGNIWRFPRVAAQYGGTTFILANIVALFIWSIPILILELVMGKHTRKGPTGAFCQFLGTRYAWMGAWIAFVTLLIGCYYSVVSGWCLKYIGIFGAGFPENMSSTTVWDNFIGSYQPVIFQFLALAIGTFVILKGIQKGVEVANKIILPMLFLLMIFLAFLAVCKPGGMDGVKYLLFRFNIEDLKNPALWLEAFAQSAWSTGAGWGLWLTYGVYCQEKTAIVRNSFLIGIGDVIASILAALMVIPTIFSTESEEAARMAILSANSQGLTFHHLVSLFNQMPSGRIVGIVFFIALFFAALTSLIAMLELGVRSFLDARLSRGKATLWTALFIGLFGIPSAFSIKFFSNQDWVWGLGLLIGGLFVALAGIIKGIFYIKTTYLPGIGKWWGYCIQYCIPVICFCLLTWWMIEGSKFEKVQWWDISGTYTPANVLCEWAGLLIILLLSNRYLAKIFASETKKERE